VKVAVHVAFASHDTKRDVAGGGKLYTPLREACSTHLGTVKVLMCPSGRYMYLYLYRGDYATDRSGFYTHRALWVPWGRSRRLSSTSRFHSQCCSPRAHGHSVLCCAISRIVKHDGPSRLGLRVARSRIRDFTRRITDALSLATAVPDALWGVRPLFPACLRQS